MTAPIVEFPFAGYEDVAAIWGEELTEPQIRMTEARLIQASAIIRQEVGLVGGLTVDQRVAVSASFGDLVRGVARDMVFRLLLNPKGRREVQIDDSRVTYDTSISTGSLYLSDSEYRSLVGGRGTAATDGAFNIRPYGLPDALSVLSDADVFQSWQY